MRSGVPIPIILLLEAGGLLVSFWKPQ